MQILFCQRRSQTYFIWKDAEASWKMCKSEYANLEKTMIFFKKMSQKSSELLSKFIPDTKKASTSFPCVIWLPLHDIKTSALIILSAKPTVKQDTLCQNRISHLSPIPFACLRLTVRAFFCNYICTFPHLTWTAFFGIIIKIDDKRVYK